MKKTFVTTILLFSLTALFAAPTVQLKFTTDGVRTEVENFNSSKKHICSDNVRLLNETNETITCRVFGKKDKDSTEELVNTVRVKPNDTQMEDSIHDLDDYKYLIIYCDTGLATYSKITCEHSDLYIYISTIIKTDTSTLAGSTTDKKEESVPYEKFNFKYTSDITNTEYAFVNSKIWIAETFNSAKNVIQMEDKDTGTIIGKGIDGFNFTFKIKIRGSKASIEFYDYYFDVGDFKIPPESKKQYDSLSEKTEAMAKKLFYTIEND